jgi:cation transport ATPase
MLLEAGKALSFMLSILSLYPVIVGAFFVPGTHWEERLSMALAKIALAACVCFASGLFFAYPPRGHGKGDALLRTLPVQMFFWTVAGVAVLFALSWYLETYYVPLLWRNQP